MVSKGLEETSKSSMATRRLLCHCGVNKFKRAVGGKLKTKANDPSNNTFMLKVYFEKKLEYDVCVVKYFESYFEDGFLSSFKFTFSFIRWVKVSLDFVRIGVLLFSSLVFTCT